MAPEPVTTGQLEIEAIGSQLRQTFDQLADNDLDHVFRVFHIGGQNIFLILSRDEDLIGAVRGYFEAKRQKQEIGS